MHTTASYQTIIRGEKKISYATLKQFIYPQGILFHISELVQNFQHFST